MKVTPLPGFRFHQLRCFESSFTPQKSYLQTPCRSHQLLASDSTNYWLQIPPIMLVDILFHTTEILIHKSKCCFCFFLQEPPIGFCRSHQLVSAGATNWFLQEPPIGLCRSHQLVSAGATNWFLQEPPIGFCRSHQLIVDIHLL